MTSPPHHKAVPAILALLLLLALAACSSAYSGTHSGTLSGMTVQPAAVPSIPVAGTVQIGANGAYQQSATQVSYKDVTSSATWSSSNQAVATVQKGLVTGTGIGSATITASLDGKTGTTVVVVGQALVLEVTPTGTDTFSLSGNRDRQFQALANYSDGTVLDRSHQLRNLELKCTRGPAVLRPLSLHARHRRGRPPHHWRGKGYRNHGPGTHWDVKRDCAPIALCAGRPFAVRIIQPEACRYSILDSLVLLNASGEPDDCESTKMFAGTDPAIVAPGMKAGS